MQHDLQTIGALGLGRQLERHRARLDPLLGAADALGHRRLRHEERAARSPRSSTRRRRATSARAATPARAPGGSTGTTASACRRVRRRARRLVRRHHGPLSCRLRGRDGPPRRRRLARSLRNSSVTRRAATVISQARGLVRHALLGPLHCRREQRLLHRVLTARRTGRSRRTSAPRTCGASSRSTSSMRAVACSHLFSTGVHHRPHLDRGVARVGQHRGELTAALDAFRSRRRSSRRGTPSPRRTVRP